MPASSKRYRLTNSMLAGLMVIYPISMLVTASVLWMIYFFSRRKLYRMEPIE